MHPTIQNLKQLHLMKIYFDLEHPEGPISKALQLVLQPYVVRDIADATVVVVDSHQHVLLHLQKLEHEKGVVQFAWGHHHPMHHLVEDYPNRFRVALFQDGQQVGGLANLCKALAEISEVHG